MFVFMRSGILFGLKNNYFKLLAYLPLGQACIYNSETKLHWFEFDYHFKGVTKVSNNSYIYISPKTGNGASGTKYGLLWTLIKNVPCLFSKNFVTYKSIFVNQIGFCGVNANEYCYIQFLYPYVHFGFYLNKLEFHFRTPLYNSKLFVFSLK